MGEEEGEVAGHLQGEVEEGGHQRQLDQVVQGEGGHPRNLEEGGEGEEQGQCQVEHSQPVLRFSVQILEVHRPKLVPAALFSSSPPRALPQT